MRKIIQYFSFDMTNRFVQASEVFHKPFQRHCSRIVGVHEQNLTYKVAIHLRTDIKNKKNINCFAVTASNLKAFSDTDFARNTCE